MEQELIADDLSVTLEMNDFCRLSTHDINRVHDPDYMRNFVYNGTQYKKQPVIMGTLLEFLIIEELQKTKLLNEQYNLTQLTTEFKDMVFPDEKLRLIATRDESNPNTQELSYSLSLLRDETLILTSNAIFKEQQKNNEIKYPYPSLDYLFMLFIVSSKEAKTFAEAIKARKNVTQYAILAAVSGCISKCVEYNYQGLGMLANEDLFPIYTGHRITTYPTLTTVLTEEVLSASILATQTGNPKRPKYTVNIIGQNSYNQALYNFDVDIALLPKKIALRAIKDI
jgi:hypothetical protein